MADVAAPAAGRDRAAILMILAAMFAFGVQDAVIKFVLENLSVWQTQLVRALLAGVVLAAAATLRPGGARLRIVSRRWALIRAALLSASYLLFYASLPFLTLTEAAAAYYVSPLLIMLFAAWLMGEPVGPRQGLAALVGFAGVLLMIRPGSDVAQPAAILPVAGAACYALGVVITRWRCRGEDPLALMSVHNAMNAAVGLCGVLAIPLLTGGAHRGWAAISGTDWGLLVATTAAFLVGAWFALSAYQRADASRLAPFEFTYLAAPPLFDLAIWGRLPDPLSWAGLALIAGSGLSVALGGAPGRRRRVVGSTDEPFR
jgi:drug/metabolite transporter (DMT)-like permease